MSQPTIVAITGLKLTVGLCSW